MHYEGTTAKKHYTNPRRALPHPQPQPPRKQARTETPHTRTTATCLHHGRHTPDPQRTDGAPHGKNKLRELAQLE